MANTRAIVGGSLLVAATGIFIYVFVLKKNTIASSQLQSLQQYSPEEAEKPFDRPLDFFKQ